MPVTFPYVPRPGRRSMRLAELRGLRAEELCDYADAAVDLAAGLGAEIVAVGISGGAAVVGWMGQNRAEMHTALLLAPFLGVRRVSPAVGGRGVALGCGHCGPGSGGEVWV